MKNKGGKIFLILSVLICSGFFVGQKCSAASAGEVVINEIAWMGSVNGGSNDEWIELKNLSGADVKLAGWVILAEDGSPKINLSGDIPAKGYFLLERKVSTVVPMSIADLLYIYSSGSLSNDGENLTLYEGDAKIDEVNGKKVGGKWIFGDSTTKQTMSRKADGLWCLSANAGGTPKAANDCGDESSIQADQSTSNSGDNSSEKIDSRFGDVVINEFVSAPEDGQNEWVELYNHSGGKLSLEGWTIADGSGAETPLTGGFSDGDYYFFVAEKFKGALNNDGDEIILYSGKHNLIDRIAYGKYGDHPENNSPAPDKGESAALKINGQKSLFDKDSFTLTSNITKGSANIISMPENSAGSADSAAPFSVAPKSDIFITEILPNLSGADRDGEFIELYNPTEKEIDLVGYRLEIEGGRSFEFGKFLNLNEVLPSQGYFALFRSQSNLILDNNGGTIRLFAPGKTSPIQILQYGPAASGLSFCDTAAINLTNPNSATKKFLANSLSVGQWVWNEAYTPGAPNQIKTVNHPPVASFSAPSKIMAGTLIDFDASDSFDEDGDIISYEWDFGDGVKLNSETPAHIFLRPGNYQVKLTASDGQEITMIKKVINVGGVFLLANPAREEAAVNKSPIVLSEKLNNKNSQTAESAGRDSAGAQTAESPSGDSAGTNSLRPRTHLASPDSAPLPRGEASTPPKEGIDSAGAVAGVKISSAVVAPASGFSIKKYKLGAALKIFGTVIVLPGVFGSQYFYIIENPPLGRGGSAPGGDGVGLAAVKIYSYKKDFPPLAMGDSVEVSGVVGGSQSEKYLNAKVAANIKIIGKAKAPAPEKITAAGFKEENLDKFVQVEGEVQEKNNAVISLEDGTGKINIYLKSNTGVSAASFKAGQKITVSGLLSKVSGALAILPRGQFDIAVASSSSGTQDIAFLQSTSSPDWTLPARGNNSQSIFYFLLIAAFFLIFSAIVFWKRKK